MPLYADNLLDEVTSRPIEGAQVYVYTLDGATEVSIQDELGASVVQPLLTGVDGDFAFQAPSGLYQLVFWKDARRIYRDRAIQVGTGPVLPTEILAALGSNDGASYIGTSSGLNVQEVINSGNAIHLGTFAEAQLEEIGLDATLLMTTGRNAAGDGGAATYVRWQAPMATLIANQEGYSWFESADGAQWTLAEINIRPEMFGAVGHPTNDEGLPLRRMFEFASGRAALITKVHRYKAIVRDEDLRIYSNTKVQGISALTCGFLRIPNAIDEQMTAPSFGVWWQDADNIEISDIFHDANRSGLGRPDPNLQRVDGFTGIGRNGRVRLNRLRVLNATGYAFYTAATSDVNYSSDTIRTDCIAINSHVSFEDTGRNTNTQNIRCDSQQYVIDGGAAVPYDVGFHRYGGVGSVYNYQCKHRGGERAVLDVLTDEFENESIVHDDCDYETDNAAVATVAILNAGFGTNGKRSKGTFIGGRVENLSGPASDFSACDVAIDGTKFKSRTATLAVGPNGICHLRGDYDIACVLPASVSPATAAIAVLVDAAAVVTRTPSGSITASHLNGGAEVAISGVVTLVDDTYIDPPLAAAVGTAPPRIMQRKKGFRVEGGAGFSQFIKPGAPNDYWTIINLDTLPVGWSATAAATDFDKFTFKWWFSQPNSTSEDYMPEAGVNLYRRLDYGIQSLECSIRAAAALPTGWRLHFDIVEEV